MERNKSLCYYSVVERCSFQSGNSKEGTRWDTLAQTTLICNRLLMHSRAVSIRLATSLIRHDGKDSISYSDLYASNSVCNS
jgi:hypothetical protein